MHFTFPSNRLILIEISDSINSSIDQSSLNYIVDGNMSTMLG